MKKSGFLFCISLLGTSVSAGAAQLNLAPDQNEYVLTPYVEILRDRDKNLTIAEIVQPEMNTRFVPNKNRNMNFGFTTSAYWFRLSLRNDAHLQGPWLLQINHPPLDRVEFYLVENGRIRVQHTTGDAFSFTTRDLPHGDFVFRLPEPLAKAVSIYIRVETEGSLVAPLTLWRADAFIVEQTLSKQVLGIYYGIIIAILFYNLFLFFTIREAAYIHYVLYLGSMLLLQMVMEGLAAEYFWPSSPKWNNYSLLILLGATNIFGTLFACRFMDLRRILPSAERLLVGLAMVMVLIVVSALWLSYRVTILAAIGQSVVISVTILLVALYLLRHGNRQVRFLLLAYGALFPGIVLLILGSLNIVEVETLSKQALKLGTALDAILLSFGLADRIRALARERESAREEAAQHRERALAIQQDFSRKLLESQENERRRVATELHDGIGQNLLVILNRLRQFGTQARASGQDLNQVAELASQSVEEARQIAHGLHPHILDRLGLTKAIESAINRGLNDDHIRTNILIDNIDGVLRKEHEIHVYRIVQEGLSNIIKHASASECWVAVQCDPRHVRITIEDDGVGIYEPERTKEGLGLAGIAERVNMIGGSFAIRPRPYGGTILAVDIPVANSD